MGHYRTRMWLHFGTLLCLLTAASCSERQKSIQAIKKLGGSVQVDKRKTGDHFVLLSVPNVTDADLEHLEGLAPIRSLTLHGTQVTDLGLEYLKRFPELECLGLSYTKVTDAGLVHLKQLTRLRFLDVQSTKCTAQGVRILQEALPRCEFCYGNAITLPPLQGEGN